MRLFIYLCQMVVLLVKNCEWIYLCMNTMQLSRNLFGIGIYLIDAFIDCKDLTTQVW